MSTREFLQLLYIKSRFTTNLTYILVSRIIIFDDRPYRGFRRHLDECTWSNTLYGNPMANQGRIQDFEVGGEFL